MQPQLARPVKVRSHKPLCCVGVWPHGGSGLKRERCGRRRSPVAPPFTTSLRHGPRSLIPLRLRFPPQPAMPEVVESTGESCYSHKCSATWNACTPEQHAQWSSFTSNLTGRAHRVCHNCAEHYRMKAANSTSRDTSIPCVQHASGCW